jgi:preprotein translocase subunit SecG
MYSVFLGIHILIALTLIGLILLQHGKGADAGAAFGSGASSTVFGARGSATFLSRATAILAILFFSNSFFLAYLSTNMVEGRKSIVERVQSGTETKGAAGEMEVQDVEIKEVKPQEKASDMPAAPPPQTRGLNAPSAPAQSPSAQEKKGGAEDKPTVPPSKAKGSDVPSGPTKQ